MREGAGFPASRGSLLIERWNCPPLDAPLKCAHQLDGIARPFRLPTQQLGGLFGSTSLQDSATAAHEL